MQFYYAYNSNDAAVLKKGVKTRSLVGVKLEAHARGFSSMAQGSKARWECVPDAGNLTIKIKLVYNQ